MPTSRPASGREQGRTVQYRSTAVSAPARIRAGPGRLGAGPFAGRSCADSGADRARSRVSRRGDGHLPL